MGQVRRLWLWARLNPALAVTSSVAIAALVAITSMPANLVLLALGTAAIGSMLFALRKAKTEGELAQVIADLKQDQLKTASALQCALQHCLRAREDRDRAIAATSNADRRFALVRGLAKAFLFDLPDKIEASKSAAPARMFLVRTALAYLDSLVKEVRDDPALLREMAVGYAQVGDLQGSLTRASQDDLAGALASYRQSAALFIALAKTHPRNAQIQRDLVVSRGKVRELEQAIGQSTKPTGSNQKQ